MQATGFLSCPGMSVKDRSLFSLSWPLVVTIALGIFQPMLDSWFLGRVSDEAAAGVGSLGALIMTMFMVLQALAQAGASIASQFLGAGRKSHARATQTLVMTGSVAMGVVMTLLIWPIKDLLVRMLGLEGVVAVHAGDFLGIFVLGMVFKALQVTLTSLIASHGRTKWNLGANALSLVINAILNYVFLEGMFGLPRMGVKGVACATVISWVAVDILLWIILRKDSGTHRHLTSLRRGISLVLPDWMRIGLPAAVEPVSYSVYQVVVTALIVRLGTLSMTARVYAGNFAMLAVIFSVGIGIGNQILVAHLVGAFEYRKANQRLRQSLVWGCGLAFGVAILVAVGGNFLLAIYTQNSEVIKLAGMCLWADAVLQPAKAANIVITNALRASGDSKFPAIVGTSMMWTLGLGGVVALGYGLHMGLLGIWLGMAFDEWTRAILNYRRWTSGAWKNKGVVH
jgi:putative MATE family efflux protein